MTGSTKRWSLMALRPLGAAAAVVLGTAAFAQEGSQGTTVDALTVTGVGVPVPEVGLGAPLFTPLELTEKRRYGRDESNYFQTQFQTLIQCYQDAYQSMPNPERMEGYEMAIEASQRLAGAASGAETRTRESQEIRVLAAQGRATQAQVEAAELARQEAVIRMMVAEQDLNEARAVSIDLQEAVRDGMPINSWRSIVAQGAAERARATDNPYNMVPRQYRDLKLENLNVVERTDAEGKVYLYISGDIRNTRTRRISVPPIAVIAVDQYGYALQTQTASGRGNIRPGEAFTFGYEYKPSPILAQSVLITFADPNRAYWLLPASADPVCTGSAGDALNPRSSGSNRQMLPSVRTFRSPPG